MIKKCIHLADLHIRNYKYHDEYVDVFKSLFSEIEKQTKGLKKEEIRIVIAGDIVHQKIIISNEQLLLCSWLFSELSELGIVVIIPGNHDLLENNTERLDSITPIIRLLNNKNIKYLTKSECVLDENVVWCNYSIIEHNTRPDIESAIKQYGTDKVYIGLFHGPLIGSKTALGYKIENGHSLELFDNLDVVMMGDIHKYQVIMYKYGEREIPCVYPSSLIQQNFGETVTKHGFVLWDIPELTYKHIEVNNDYPFYVFKVESLDDIENNNEVLLNV